MIRKQKAEAQGVSGLYKDLGYSIRCNKNIQISSKYKAALNYIHSLEGELRARGVEL